MQKGIGLNIFCPMPSLNESKMGKIINFIEKISKIGAYISAIFMLLIVAIISTEIFLRSIFNKSLLISDEYSAYFMVASIFFGLAYTLRKGKHIKITIITSRIKSNTVSLILDIAVYLIAFGISTFACYFAFLMVNETRALDMRADSIAETPLWIPEISVFLGFLLLSLQLLAMILRRIKNYK